MKKNDKTRRKTARRDAKDLTLDKAKDAKVVRGGVHLWTARN